jgi:hypothetical protein
VYCVGIKKNDGPSGYLHRNLVILIKATRISIEATELLSIIFARQTSLFVTTLNYLETAVMSVCIIEGNHYIR